MNNLKLTHPLAYQIFLPETLYKVEEKVNFTPSPVESQPLVEAETSTKDFIYLGENNKYILILANLPQVKTLSQDELTFLEKILSAKKWTMRDVALVNIAFYLPLEFDALKSYFACAKCIGLGVLPEQLGLGQDTPAQALFEHQNTQIFFSYSLGEIQRNEEHKRQFWNLLKHF